MFRNFLHTVLPPALFKEVKNKLLQLNVYLESFYSLEVFNCIHVERARGGIMQIEMSVTSLKQKVFLVYDAI